MNKSELIDKIFTSRENLLANFARIGDDRSSLVILHGEWSAKDLIGHLCFWEERVSTLFSVLKAGKLPEPFLDMDLLNAEAVAEFAKLSLDQVRKREEIAYQKILTIINEASEEELFDPNYFAWTEGRNFAEFISDNTWGHYDEHIPEMIAWLKRIA